MDNTQLKSIATGIISTGYWPAHLGLTTVTEKIEWLAKQVETMVDGAESVERLQDEVEDLTEQVMDTKEYLADAQNKITERMECENCELCDDHK